ncbi:MAG: hypothetical protein GY861_00920 [bacterium]|nr:hypothetical protein [bacterium]
MPYGIRIGQSGPTCQLTTFGNGTDDSSGNGNDDYTRLTESTELVIELDNQQSISMDVDNLDQFKPAIVETDLKLLGTYKPTCILAHYSTMDNFMHTLYLGMTERQDTDPLFEWEKIYTLIPI